MISNSTSLWRPASVRGAGAPRRVARDVNATSRRAGVPPARKVAHDRTGGGQISGELRPTAPVCALHPAACHRRTGSAGPSPCEPDRTRHPPATGRCPGKPLHQHHVSDDHGANQSAGCVNTDSSPNLADCCQTCLIAAVPVAPPEFGPPTSGEAFTVVRPDPHDRFPEGILRPPRPIAA